MDEQIDNILIKSTLENWGYTYVIFWLLILAQFYLSNQCRHVKWGQTFSDAIADTDILCIPVENCYCLQNYTLDSADICE